MITRAIELIIVEYSEDPSMRGRRLRATWEWSPRDPFVIAVSFAEDKTWEFDRDILLTGVREPAGLADVKLWPSGDKHCRLRLESHEGMVVFEMELRPLRRFAQDIALAVPQQREVSDAEIERHLTKWSAR